MKLLKKPLALPWALVSATAAVSPAVLAQTAPAASALEEVVVTARRKEEGLQAVPITVAAFSDEQLRQQSINTTQDLQYAVPGLFLTGSGSRTNTLYSIRGQSRPVIGQGAPGVVTYFADVPLPTGASSVPQYDIGSIQVLKGPQGTLFGRNTTGGAILTYPTKPTHEFGGYLETGVGNYNYTSVEGAVNIPLVQDKVALRIAGQTQHRDGYTEHVGVGPDQDQLDSQSARISLLVEPGDWITNNTILDYHLNDASASAAILVRGQAFPSAIPGLGAGALRFDLLAAAQDTRGPRKTDLNLPASQEQFEQFGFTNRTDLEFEGWGITNILGYRQNDVYVRSQIDGVGNVPFELAGGGIVSLPLHLLEGQQLNETRQITEEFHVKGDAFNGAMEWLVGAFYLKNEPDGVMASATGFFSPVAQTYQFVEEESKALFANVGYDLSPLAEGLKFNLGVRRTWDESSICSGTGEAPGVNGPTTAGFTDGDCHLLADASEVEEKFNANTWTVGLDWQINESVFAYITSRRGYRAGGINAPAFAGPLTAYQTFDPEKTTDYEVGVRTDWQFRDMTGRFNLAVFQSEATDVQLVGTGVTTAYVPGGCSPGNTFIDGDCLLSNDPAQSALNINAGDT